MVSIIKTFYIIMYIYIDVRDRLCACCVCCILSLWDALLQCISVILLSYGKVNHIRQIYLYKYKSQSQHMHLAITHHSRVI